MSSKYYIVYPCGDRSQLSVVEIVDALDYELDDYAVASQKNFDDENEAVKYAEELALKHGKKMKYPHNYKDYLD